MNENRKADPAADGRPVEERRSEPAPDDLDDELPDESTVESVGY